MAAINSYGTLLQMSDASLANHATIAEVRDINGVKAKAKVVETTSHSTSTPWVTRQPTLLDGGQVTFDINLNLADSSHSTAAGLRYVFKNRQKRNFKIVYTSDMGSQFDQFDGYITGLDMKAAVDNIYMTSVTIDITGTVTLG